jgi:SAM-dependent methyltransferase
MARSASLQPAVDPTPIFELFRGIQGTELLTAAVAEFDLFARLSETPKSFHSLRNELALAERPANVLFTAMRAMRLLDRDSEGRLCLTPMAREHLVPGAPFDVSGYVRLASDNPSVQSMITALKKNRPAGADDAERGVAFIFRDGVESAMEREEQARFLTMSLAGRARNVAPYLAERVSLAGVTRLLDVAGGSGIYCIALLQNHPQLTAVVMDRPEVLKVAAEMAAEFGVADRLECLTGDMFADPLPSGCQTILLSNALHDWDVSQCEQLVQKCADALPAGGRLLIHDVYLNDDLGGPLPIALYSAALFSLTEGRAYSAAEYRSWLTQAGLTPSAMITPTLVHCGVLEGRKR